MRKLALYLSICTIFTAICAIPVSYIKDGEQPNHDLINVHVSVHSNSQVNSVILLRHLSTMYTRDFFSDIIRATLNMSVKDLLLYVEKTYKDLDSVTNQGVNALNKVLPLASPEMRAKIVKIKNNALKKVFETIGKFLKDLGNVLPALSFDYSIHDPSSDIVYALLGQTLEELVTALAKALEASLQLLNQTILEFENLAKQAEPEVASALSHVSDEYLNQGKSIIMPTLNKLGQIVDVSVRVTKKMTKLDTDKQYPDLLDGVISTILGINVQYAAAEADNALSKLTPLIESTRDELKIALQSVDNESYAELVEKIENIYDSAIDDVIRDTKPIFLSLLNFNDVMRRDKTFTYNLGNSLLGIGIKNFKSYAQNVTFRVETRVAMALSEVVASAMNAGLPVAIKVFRVLQNNLLSAKLISHPLLECLKPILQCKKEQSESIGTTVDASHSLVIYDVDKESSSWNDDDGFAYNRDPLINAVSSLLGFQVSDATETLKNALELLDELTESAFGELKMILHDEEPSLQLEILDVMNETLTNIHITLQPMLDVLLPFLPDLIRPNKQVAIDIYNGINGVNLERFLHYCTYVARTIPEITDVATIHINTAAARAGPLVHGKIESLLRTSDGNIKSIIKPFLDIISPIISPH